MTILFAPQFFLVLGVDVFLGGSIVTALLDRYFPAPLPYIFDAAAIVGLAQLLMGRMTPAMSPVATFYLDFGFALVAVLSALGAGLYLAFLGGRRRLGGLVGGLLALPAGAVVLYFAAAYVQGTSPALPWTPVVPLWAVVLLIASSTTIIVWATVRASRAPPMGWQAHPPAGRGGSPGP